MSKHNKFFGLFVLTLTVGLFSSCSGGKDDKKPSIDTQVTDYSKASCEYKAGEGDAATTVVPEAKQQVGAFGKIYDRSLLNAILTASATETVRFAQLTNVTYYSVAPHKSNSCLMSSFLPEATSFYEQKFQSLGDDVLGLYLSPKSSIVEGRNEQPIIMVRRDANRWVIVHEYMHHLFSKEVQEINKSDEEIRSEVKQASDNLEPAETNYKKTKSEVDTKAYLEVLKKLTIAFPELLKRFTLEEMAIESVLAQVLAAGQFRNVPTNQAINGAAYTYQSAKKAESNLKLVQLINTEGRDILKMTAHFTAEEKAQMKSAYDNSDKKVSDYLTELRALKAKAATKLRQEGIDPDRDLSGFLAVNKSKNNHIGCAHGQEIEPILNQIENSFLNNKSN